MQLINLINGLTPKVSTTYGSVIFFDDIFNACKLFGLDNQHIVELKLGELERKNLVTVVYDQHGLVIGVKLP